MLNHNVLILLLPHFLCMVTGAVVGGVLLIAVAIVTLFSVMACFLRHRKQSKSEEGGEGGCNTAQCIH